MRWIWYVLAVLWALDALRMRARLKSIPVLPATDRADAEGYRFVTLPGVQVDGRTRASAAAFAEQHDLALLDLIPFDAPTLLTMGIVQLMDPRTYRKTRIAVGHSSGYALMADRDVATRARLGPEDQCDPVTLIRTMKRLKICALSRAGLAVAPGMHAPPGNLAATWPVFSEIVGGTSHSWFMARGIMLAVLVAGLFVAPAAGATALLVMHLQPIVVFAGLPLRPRDLGLTVLLRGPIEVWSWFQTLVTRVTARPEGPDPIEARRALYTNWLKDGIERFFEPRRQTCPICESSQLRERLRTIDVVQRKPGEFVLEECGDCGHIFQNPRLSVAGLEFYYCDFYDGLRTPVAETLSRSPTWMYLDRARAITGLGTPARWLDVGTAHGHFCCAAQEAWPDTQFDGLDISTGVEEAERAGWIKQGYRGFFPKLADDIAGQYDVLSLFHCLEHTPDPRQEIAAAYKALEPGGLLVIEVPDPESWIGRVCGRFWFPWFQPQHLHLLSVKNMSRLLREAGFEPALVQRGEAHIQIDFFATLMVFYGWIAPKPDAPWLPPSGRIKRLKHFLVWNFGFPLIPFAILLDIVSAPLARRIGLSNAYRVVARRDAQPLRRPDAVVEIPVPVGAPVEAV